MYHRVLGDVNLRNTKYTHDAEFGDRGPVLNQTNQNHDACTANIYIYIVRKLILKCIAIPGRNTWYIVPVCATVLR